MLDPDYLEESGERVAAVYRQIEAEMLDYLAGRMIAGDVSGQRAQTALHLLAQSAAPKLAAILKAHEREVSAAVRAEVEEALERSEADDLARIAQGLGVGAAEAAGAAATVQTALTVAGVEEILARRNLGMADAAREAFLAQSVWAVTQVNTGAMTTERALHAAVRRLERDGISVVTYRDADTGRTTVRNKVDVAVRRHIRTQIAQAAARRTEQVMDAAGVEFVEVSSHTGSRPSHQDWEGRVYSRNGDRTVGGVRYRDFKTACRWGDVADGIGGANCRHSYAAWFPGMPRTYRPNPEHPSGKSNDEVYALTQKQRAAERGIRATKRELRGAQMLYDADPTIANQLEASKLQLRLKNQQARLRKLVADNPKVLQRSPRREWAGDMPKAKAPCATFDESGRILRMEVGESLVRMKGERNSMSVSRVVNTKAYRDAFEEVPAPKAVRQSAYVNAGRILQQTNGTEVEHMVAIDARTGAVIADNLGKPGQRYRTGFTSNEAKRLKDSKNGVITIHNHPGSRPPSYQDVITAAQHDSVKASIVIGHDGSVWYVTATPEIATILKSNYNRLKDSMGDLAEPSALKALLSSKEAGKRLDWRKLR